MRLTPQLGLVPIGPDPDSGLWEFGHLATGRPALRSADRRLVLEPEMGLVLVLLPGGRVPVDDSGDGIQKEVLTLIDLDPFFLSKYEMTQEQWNRIGGWRRSGQKNKGTMLPVTDISWDDCQVVLLQHAGWLRLPSEAQWEYGCRARTTTPWWTGADERHLRGTANIEPGLGEGETAIQRASGIRVGECSVVGP